MDDQKSEESPLHFHMLPPCKVCETPGTGFHYGVTTCGACKGFFSRCLGRKEPHQCYKNYLCKIGPEICRRKCCPKCRYDKCIAVGMSKNACKVGRYTLIKKSKDVQEALKYCQKNQLSQSPPISSEGKTNQQQEGSPVTQCEINSISTSLLDVSLGQDVPLSLSDDDIVNGTSATRGTPSLTPPPSIMSCSPYDDFTPPETGSDILNMNLISTINGRLDHNSNNNTENNSGVFYTEYGDTSSVDNCDNISNPINDPNHNELLDNDVTCNDDQGFTRTIRNLDTMEMINDCFQVQIPTEFKSSVDDTELPFCFDLDSPITDKPIAMPLDNHVNSSNIANVFSTQSDVDTDTNTSWSNASQNPNYSGETATMDMYSKISPALSNYTYSPFINPHAPISAIHNLDCTEQLDCTSDLITLNTVRAKTGLTSVKEQPSIETLKDPDVMDENHAMNDHTLISPSSTNVILKYSHCTDVQSPIQTIQHNNDTEEFCSTYERSNTTTVAFLHEETAMQSPNSDTATGSLTSRPWAGKTTPQSTKATDLDQFPYDFSPTISQPSLNSTDLDFSNESPSSSCSSLISNASNKRSPHPVEDCPSSNKKQCVQVNRESDSTKYHSQLSKKRHIVPLNAGYSSEPRPLTVFMVEPDPMKYNLSIFEQFPFKSFETRSLAPLLKLCYDAGEWVDGYLFQLKHPSKRILSKDYKPENHSAITIDSEALSVSPTICPQRITSASEVTYDALEMENLFKHLRAIHTRYYGPESAFLTASERDIYLELYMKICHFYDSLKGKLDLIDDEKYFMILESTGIDVDKRREWFSVVFEDFDDSFIRDARFIRALPGFKQLAVKDRVILTKATYPFFMSLRHKGTTDKENDVLIDEERGTAVRISTIGRVLPGTTPVCDQWYRAEDLISMDLSFEEMIIMKIIMIMRPDSAEELKEDHVAIEWHNTYLKCLLHVERKLYGAEGDSRFNKFVENVHRLRASCLTPNTVRIALGDTVSRLMGHQGSSTLMPEIARYWDKYNKVIPAKQ